MKLKYSIIGIMMILICSCSITTDEIRIEELDISAMSCGWGTPQFNKSIQSTPLSIGGQVFQHGIGTHATSTLLIKLNSKGKIFTAKVGVDDASGEKASIEFYVLGDRKILWESGVMKKGDSVKYINLDLKGIKKLGLLVTDGKDGISYDHANWVDGKIIYKGYKPEVMVKEIAEEEIILTPPAQTEPRINGPKIYGIRPGSPFLYRIPVTGERPIKFSSRKLPDGLFLDENSGIITGRILKAGEYPVELIATNSIGKSEQDFKIIVGDTLALTPPMGWNSWYIHYDRVSDSLMRIAADVMISSGMADYGYQYVNIDDCWMVKANSNDPEVGGPMRDNNGKLLTNKRFPDMNEMTDYIHSKGLKAGTYISPGATTCAGYAGSYGHEKEDAQTFAEWGFDFLKYDWCSYSRIAEGNSVEDLKAPYEQMWDILHSLDRDIVLNLCQYGMGNVWEWGGEVGNSWRTTGDLGLATGSNMPGFYNIGISNAQHWNFARPGAWNDPDYILIGWVGSAHKMGEGEKTKLSPNEQYFYMSMWSLMASPLIFSGDMAKLDKFTLNILCNSEVIDINQDILGQQARIIRNTNNELIMVKELEDGSKAVGLFHITGELTKVEDYFKWDEKNRSKKISISNSDIGVNGQFKVRDVWRQKERGIFNDQYETEVPYHGVKLIIINELPDNNTN